MPSDPVNGSRKGASPSQPAPLRLRVCAVAGAKVFHQGLFLGFLRELATRMFLTWKNGVEAWDWMGGHAVAGAWADLGSRAPCLLA